MLIANGISKQLGKRKILDAVNFEAAAGEIIALLGPSGCGKTTLLRTLSLVDLPDSGKIVVGDKAFSNLLSSPWQTIYPEITVVFQQFPLWPHLNVKQNVLLPLELRGAIPIEDRMNYLCAELGLSGLLERFPTQLSVGQRQRVCLVRALLLQPKYLLLDEITSAQDVEHVKSMMGVIRQAASNGMCIVIATHLIRFARQLATRFYFMDHGRVLESGTTDILNKPESTRLKDFLLVSDEL